ncbi:hypothetical protein HFD88_001703 [Aspergillus terreus]|nr:hypothetical protein HFD88_001703 [Aspergillus terreus]
MRAVSITKSSLRWQIRHVLELSASGLWVLVLDPGERPNAYRYQECRSIETSPETSQNCLSTMQVAEGQMFGDSSKVFEMQATRHHLRLSYPETGDTTLGRGPCGSHAIGRRREYFGGASPGRRREHASTNSGHRYVPNAGLRSSGLFPPTG